jgi:hypothetical protein
LRTAIEHEEKNRQFSWQIGTAKAAEKRFSAGELFLFRDSRLGGNDAI